MIENVELTLNHVNLGSLSEFAAMTLFGVAQSHRVTRGLGISIRDITDAAGVRLYPGYFTTHLVVPPSAPLSQHRVWDRVDVGVDAKSFGRMILETRYALGRPGEVSEDPARWEAAKLPTMHAGTMFIIDGHRGEPQPAVPRADLVAEMEKLKAPPPSVARFTEIHRRGRVDPQVQGPLRTEAPLSYRIVPGRDVVGDRALMFSSFSHLMDLLERTLLVETVWPRFSRELVATASILDREMFYFANCGGSDSVLAEVSGYLSPCPRDLELHSRDFLPGAFLDLSIELYQAEANVLLAAAKIRKIFAIPSARRVLLREVDRLLERFARPDVIEAPPAPPPAPPIPEVKSEPPVADNLGRVRAAVAAALETREDAIEDDVNFGTLGMDSLRMVQLIHRLERIYGRPIEPAWLTEHPTLRDLAAKIESASGEPRPEPVTSAVCEDAERTSDGRIYGSHRVRWSGAPDPAPLYQRLVSSTVEAAVGKTGVVRDLVVITAPPTGMDQLLTVWIEPDGRFRIEDETCLARGQVVR